MPTTADLKTAWRQRLAEDFAYTSVLVPVVQWEGSTIVGRRRPRPFRFRDLCLEVLRPYIAIGGSGPDIRVEALYELAAETGRLDELEHEWRRLEKG